MKFESVAAPFELPLVAAASTSGTIILGFGALGSLNPTKNPQYPTVSYTGTVWMAWLGTLAKESDIPTELPNPHSLNIKIGDTTTSYDGSAAKTVEIPGGGGTDASLGITGAAVGQALTVKTIDKQGKPTEWESAALARVDGSNIPTSVRDTFRTNIAALPGVKVYGKADANGKIKAYIDAACTEEAGYTMAMGLADYGNALLIYDHKTYQCVGFEEPASMQGSGNYLVAVFFRSEIATDSAGTAVLKVETAKLNILDYLSGAINAPITTTAGELPLTTTTTT